MGLTLGRRHHWNDEPTWQALPDCDICFVYTVTERDISDLQGGKMKTSESVMEDVADFYKISSVHFGIEGVGPRYRSEMSAEDKGR